MIVEQATRAIHATAATSISAATVSIAAGTHQASYWIVGAAQSTLAVVQWLAAAVAIVAGIVSVALAFKRNKHRRY